MTDINCDHAGGSPEGLTQKVTTVMAIAAGLAGANVYAAQPLLNLIGKSFAMRSADLGLAVTLTQAGYACGLILLVPLGDLLDRRRIIIGQSGLSAAALVAAALAPKLGLLLLALALVGMLAVTVQTLVAYASALALPGLRGAAVGKVTGGVVVGILGARVVSGSLGDLLGWRAVYLVSAAASGAVALGLSRMLPVERRRASSMSYGEIVISVPRLFASDPVLRLRAAFAFVVFAAFSIFWTALVLPLTDPRAGLSHGQVGLFGMVGIAGALGARGAGRMTDRGHARFVTGGAMLLLCLSWLPISLLDHSLWWLAVGIILLDLAVQAVHVTNQTIIVGRHADAAGRVIAGYMVFYSCGSGIGGATATLMYSAWGWSGVCAMGGAVSIAGLLLWLMQLRGA